MPQRADARSLLLVEDNPDDRSRIHRMLRGRRRQYQILDCSSGVEAVELIERGETRFDCVLLDQYLPDMHGDEVMRRLRAATERLPVAVILLTGHDDDDMAALALELGAEDYLLKDEVTPHALVRSIENVLEKFEIRRQLDAQRVAVELRNERLEVMRAELEVRLEELTTATRARDRFVAMMSHEMRTPLNAILGYTELLELEIEGQINVGHRRNLDRIRIGGRHLLDLVNDVLDLARADARKLDLQLRPVDANAVIDEIAALLENSATAKGLVLTRQLDASLPLVSADVQRLRTACRHRRVQGILPGRQRPHSTLRREWARARDLAAPGPRNGRRNRSREHAWQRLGLHSYSAGDKRDCGQVSDVAIPRSAISSLSLSAFHASGQGKIRRRPSLESKMSPGFVVCGG